MPDVAVGQRLDERGAGARAGVLDGARGRLPHVPDCHPVHLLGRDPERARAVEDLAGGHVAERRVLAKFRHSWK
jgi:hypothetical protein